RAETHSPPARGIGGGGGFRARDEHPTGAPSFAPTLPPAPVHWPPRSQGRAAREPSGAIGGRYPPVRRSPDPATPRGTASVTAGERHDARGPSRPPSQTQTRIAGL